MENTSKILYVDDEQNNLNVFVAYFRRNKSYEIHTCRSAGEGLKILETVPVAVVIADQRMPKMTGVEFLEAIRMTVEPVKIVVTAHRDTSAIVQAYDEGRIFRYFDKPWQMEDLENAIEEACRIYGEKTTKAGNS